MSEQEKKHKAVRHKPIYPENLYCAVFGDNEYDVPYGWEQDVEYLFTTITEREKEVLLSRFKDEKTLKEIGKDLSVTSERVRQVLAKALRKLRHPERQNVLTIGIDQVLKNKEAEEERKRKVKTEMARQLEQKRQEMINAPFDPDIPIKISDIEMSARAYHCLIRNGVKYIQDLSNLTESKLAIFENLGAKTLREIKAIMRDYAVVFKEGDE